MTTPPTISDVPTRTVTLGDVTPEELAILFARMDSDRQAQFFNALADRVGTWPGLGWCGQCAYIIDGLSDEGASVVLTLAGHIQDREASSKAKERGL